MYDSIITESQYLPPIEYFVCLLNRRTLFIEKHEHYQKQTYRNRCYILGANNVQRLTIPVTNGSRKTVMDDLKIDYTTAWHLEHWKSIQSAYGRAPFFEYFSGYFEPLYLHPPTYLLDFNLKLLTVCLDLLNLHIPMFFTEKYQYEHSDELLDIRSVITPKVSYVKRSFFEPKKYSQVFGKDFVENLSIIDLLMNEGPNALSLVTNSKRTG